MHNYAYFHFAIQNREFLIAALFHSMKARGYNGLVVMIRKSWNILRLDSTEHHWSLPTLKEATTATARRRNHAVRQKKKEPPDSLMVHVGQTQIARQFAASLVLT
ncbi:hypothetical protein AVEN_9963-1 [Araneus ventricosus]|uniref:Uncharacterized protein n=1 Tax=Araneus ventricosus TaxID=182803 RepID=A0A4Y2FB38_ARAVE|nr:hypothetical protein AVEN_9963-1 [Araneus ventricosus]